MQDLQAYLEKLHKDAVDCALVSKHAIDPQKKELFDRLASHLATLTSQVERAVETNASAEWLSHSQSRPPEF
jgi:hypothetical protein